MLGSESIFYSRIIDSKWRGRWIRDSEYGQVSSSGSTSSSACTPADVFDDHRCWRLHNDEVGSVCDKTLVNLPFEVIRLAELYSSRCVIYKLKQVMGGWLFSM